MHQTNSEINPHAFSAMTFAQEVVFANGALGLLDERATEHGWRRLMLCATPSMERLGYVQLLGRLLSDRLVTVFDGVRSHVQDTQVDEAEALAADHQIDAVIGMGGGSPIGMAKAVAARRRVPVIAIPTTYAGSEMTSIYGITHSRENPPRKVTQRDPAVVPRLVIYDPHLTLGLAPEMTASSGINALAHCVEALYSIRRHPLSTLAATAGAEHIVGALFRCYSDGEDLAARTELMLGAYLAGFSLANVPMGLHHGLCHVLGGTAGIPHGIANAVVLPHAVRFNADATAAQLRPLVEALRLDTEGFEPIPAVLVAANALADLVRRMGLPQRLRDVGVTRDALPELARLAFANHTVQSNPKPITDVMQLETLLKAMW